MDLHLSDEEARELRATLESALGELHMEIANTDNAAFRRALTERRVLLEGLLSRLALPVAVTPPG